MGDCPLPKHHERLFSRPGPSLSLLAPFSPISRSWQDCAQFTGNMPSLERTGPTVNLHCLFCSLAKRILSVAMRTPVKASGFARFVMFDDCGADADC